MMERKIATGMEGYSKRKTSKKNGSIPFVASRTESTAFAPLCSLESFILTSLRCIPEPPKLLKPVAHTCPCKTSYSLSRSSAIRFFYYTFSSSRLVYPPAATALFTASTRVLRWPLIRYLCLSSLQLMSPLRFFLSFISFILILF